MTVPYRKKLIEVALPLKAINEASAREKSIRHGHPSTLHLWWARRPLAACRAVLFASLVDDPDSDPQFQKADGSVDEEAAGTKRAQLFSLIEELVQWENSNNPEVIRSARAEIARCVASRKVELGELSKDDHLTPDYTVGRLIRDAWVLPRPMGIPKAKKGKKEDVRVRYTFSTTHLPPESVVNDFLATHAPPVLDPFAGGGSIPLEAQRLGLRAYASDLNPVAVLINKALIEIPPNFAGWPPVNPKSRKDPRTNAREWRGAEGLAEDVRYYGMWIRDEAEKRIGHLYPKIKITEEMAEHRHELRAYVGDELTIIAWLWARTVASPNPAVNGCHVPLASSFWLSKRTGAEAWVKPIAAPDGASYRFEVRDGKPDDIGMVSKGTKLGRGCKFKCLLSGQPIDEEHIKQAARAGQLGSRLMAIVAEGSRGRVYITPTAEDEKTASIEPPSGISEIEAPLANDPRNLWCLGYGLDHFAKLFTPRQLTTLAVLSELAQEVWGLVDRDAAAALGDSRGENELQRSSDEVRSYANAVATYLAFAVSKAAEGSTTLCTWSPLPTKLHVTGTFRRQALPMVWDYAESNVFAASAGEFLRMADLVSKVVANFYSPSLKGTVQQADAAKTLAAKTAIISTDPPYYDNIGYADLSDFFYVWLRRTLSNVFPSITSTMLTPKEDELIASPYRHSGEQGAARDFFETGLFHCFKSAMEASLGDYPMSIYYAYKQAEGGDSEERDGANGIASTGWETFLDAITGAGLSVLGTWPVRTERGGRSIGIGTNALASSIVLVCRPRSPDAALATRREFMNTLKQELPDALSHLQQGNIAPVDLSQAAIGPGMAVFTRYAKVMEADGSAMSVRTALTLINQTLDEALAEQEGEFDAETRWALAWFEEHGMDEGLYGTAETLSKAKNTAVKVLEKAGIVRAKSSKVRLVTRDELSDDWDPVTDKRLTQWEVVQHLIRALETGGEPAAAQLLRKLGGMADAAKDLAYRLFTLCERKKWAQEAQAYNALGTSWGEIEKLARAVRADEVVQKTLI